MIIEALRVLLLGVLGVFLVMALIYVAIVALSRIRVPSKAGATKSSRMNGSVAAPAQPSDVGHASATEPIVVDGLDVDDLAAADEWDDWSEQYEYDDEIIEYGYEFSDDGEFDGNYEYEYVVDAYYPENELIDADRHDYGEKSRSPQIEEAKP